MYGPPPDPRQALLAAGPLDQPQAWVLTLAVAALLLAWGSRQPPARRNPWLIAGLTLLLTAPALGLVGSAVLGSFPTIDKEGSLLFYLDGVHVRQLVNPLQAAQDPASRLIGVHTGHLWVTQLFDLVLPSHGAMNAQGLLNLGLGWACMTVLCRAAGASPALALALGFPFGMGLHVVRDLNWYTIEKSAVFWLPLFAWCWLRAWQEAGTRAGLVFAALGGAVYGLMSWMNLYFGLVAAALGGLAVAGELGASFVERGLRPRTRTLLLASVACALPGLVLAMWQSHVMAGGPALATPEQFLWGRAALDSVVLWPPAWNRLELWRALNPVAVALAAWGAWRGRRLPLVQFCVLAGVVLAGLSLGPVLLWTSSAPQEGVHNPAYFAAWHLIPGFDRVAKPEVFFEGTWMLALVAGAAGLRDWRPRFPEIALLVAVVAAWLLLVRTHPVYPPFAEFQATDLDPAWKERVFSAP